MSEDDRDLSDAERRALRALADGPEPPRALAAAAVRRLAEAGLISEGAPVSPRRKGWGMRLAAAAAALVLFGLGWAVGARRAAVRSPASVAPRFALFLYDAPDEKGLTEAEMGARIDEYRSWARGVRASGREIAGEKLQPEGRFVGPGPPDSSSVSGWPLGGYFVISAPDMESAIAVAKTCPHVKHGGRVEVRPIART